jgi:predicted nucleic acid-binding protein
VTPVFLDTSALYDATDPRSAWHRACRDEYERLLRAGGELVLTELIVAELHALALRRAGPAPAHALVGRLSDSPRITILPVGRPERMAALELLDSRPGRPCSLADAVSFAAMRRLGIDTVFARDAGFAAEGFAVIPALDGRPG